jgi:hypothetical protein
MAFSLKTDHLARYREAEEAGVAIHSSPDEFSG